MVYGLHQFGMGFLLQGCSGGCTSLGWGFPYSDTQELHQFGMECPLQ